MIVTNLFTLSVAFVVLKLAGVLRMSWLLALSPVWGVMAFAFLAGIFGLPLAIR